MFRISVIILHFSSFICTHIGVHMHVQFGLETHTQKSVTMFKRKARGNDNCNFNKL